MNAYFDGLEEMVGKMNSDYLSVAELHALGFGSVGKNTKISRKCSFYGISGYIGDDVRVDDFCIFKGHVELQDYVHLAAYGMVSGAHAPVVIERFVGIAARATILSGSDDYSADTLGNPCTPEEYTTIIKGPVKIKLGAMIGAHCVIMPNVTIGEGSSIGSGCMVSFNVPDGGIVRSRSTVLSTKRRNVNRIKQFALEILENKDGEP